MNVSDVIVVAVVGGRFCGPPSGHHGTGSEWSLLQPQASSVAGPQEPHLPVSQMGGHHGMDGIVRILDHLIWRVRRESR